MFELRELEYPSRSLGLFSVLVIFVSFYLTTLLSVFVTVSLAVFLTIYRLQDYSSEKHHICKSEETLINSLLFFR